MAYDKAVDSTALETGLTTIADAIRAKGGTSSPLEFPQGMADAVAAISGGGGGTTGLYMAEITPSADSEILVITHNLGTTDILFALCFAKKFGDVVPNFDGAVFKAWAKTELPVRVTSSQTVNVFNPKASWDIASNYATVSAILSESYIDEVVDENIFKFQRAGSAKAKYYAGVTYTVIIASSALGGT